MDLAQLRADNERDKDELDRICARGEAGGCYTFSDLRELAALSTKMQRRLVLIRALTSRMPLRVVMKAEDC